MKGYPCAFCEEVWGLFAYRKIMRFERERESPPNRRSNRRERKGYPWGSCESAEVIEEGSGKSAETNSDLGSADVAVLLGSPSCIVVLPGSLQSLKHLATAVPYDEGMRISAVATDVHLQV